MAFRKPLTPKKKDTIRRHIEEIARFIDDLERSEFHSIVFRLYCLKARNLLADAVYALDSGDGKKTIEDFIHRAELCQFKLTKLTIGEPLPRSGRDPRRRSP